MVPDASFLIPPTAYGEHPTKTETSTMSGTSGGASRGSKPSHASAPQRNAPRVIGALRSILRSASFRSASVDHRYLLRTTMKPMEQPMAWVEHSVAMSAKSVAAHRSFTMSIVHVHVAAIQGPQKLCLEHLQYSHGM